MPRRWNSPLWNGSTGSTTAASSSPSAISLPPKPRRATMPKSPVRPWQPDSNKTVSGKPGAVQVGRLFKEQQLPLSLALNAQFPEQRPAVWNALRSLVPDAPIIAHGLNNSTELLPLGRGLDAQTAYIRHTLDLIEKSTGVRSQGWSSPSVFPNVDTFSASAAAGVRYSLDGMDSDVLSQLVTSSGPVTLIPYPAVTVDMGHYLSRSKEAGDL